MPSMLCEDDIWRRGIDIVKDDLRRKSGKLDLTSSGKSQTEKSYSGFAMDPSRLFIIDNCASKEGKLASLSEIKLVYLPFYRIRTVGAIQDCKNLTFCILPNNYISFFHALIYCKCLKRLDLHNNQISKLPGGSFWRELSHLRVLNLHNNKIENISNVQAMSRSKSLLALTLHDTPLSRQNEYRHNVVNIMWSLKALDRYVIGDDEIIEEVTFIKRFQAQNPTLFVDLCPQKEKFNVITSTFDSEMNIFRKIVSDVHLKQKHGCPIIIIQRWLRGFLCRRKLNISYIQIREKLKKVRLLVSHPPSPTRYNRFGLFSEDFTIEELKTVLPPDLLVDFELLQKDVYCAYAHTATSDCIFHVLDNSPLLSKPRVWKILQEDSKRSAVASLSKLFCPSLVTNDKSIRRKLALKDMQRYFGVLQRRLKSADQKRNQKFSRRNSSESNWSWRVDKNMGIAGEKHEVIQLDPTAHKITRSKLCGIDVRDSIQYWHEMKELQVKPKIMKPKPPVKLKNNFPYHLLKSFDDRRRVNPRAHRTARNSIRVTDMEEAKQDGRRIAAAFHGVKRSKALSQKRKDKLLLKETERMRKIENEKTHKLVRNRRIEAFERRTLKDDERYFATDFNQGMACVANALHKHERLANKFLIAAEKDQITSQIKEELEDARVKSRISKQRNITMKQIKGRNEKELLEQSVCEAAEWRMAEACDNVARQKAAKKIRPKMYQHHLPLVTTFSGIGEAEFTGLYHVTSDQLQLFSEVAQEICKPQYSQNLFASLSSFSSCDPEESRRQRSKLTRTALV